MKSNSVAGFDPFEDALGMSVQGVVDRTACRIVPVALRMAGPVGSKRWRLTFRYADAPDLREAEILAVTLGPATEEPQL